jgi:hypothetical protein
MHTYITIMAEACMWWCLLFFGPFFCGIPVPLSCYVHAPVRRAIRRRYGVKEEPCHDGPWPVGFWPSHSMFLVRCMLLS